MRDAICAVVDSRPYSDSCTTNVLRTASTYYSSSVPNRPPITAVGRIPHETAASRRHIASGVVAGARAAAEAEGRRTRRSFRNRAASIRSVVGPRTECVRGRAGLLWRPQVTVVYVRWSTTSSRPKVDTIPVGRLAESAPRRIGQATSLVETAEAGTFGRVFRWVGLR